LARSEWKVSSSSGLKVHFRPEDEQDARIIEQACADSLVVIEKEWGLKVPSLCSVYVMTDWRSFIFDSANSIQRLRYKLGYPLWARRIQAMWEYVGGWALPYRRAPVVGIKPARLMITSDRTIGRQIFRELTDPVKKIRSITAHELTHAAAAHLSLPAWLNEGLAMRSADAVLGEETVLPQTVEQLKNPRRGLRTWALMNTNLQFRGSEDLVYRYVRGYWITRYLQATNPQGLRLILTRKLPQRILYQQLQALLETRTIHFWAQIDRLTYEAFKKT